MDSTCNRSGVRRRGPRWSTLSWCAMLAFTSSACGSSKTEPSVKSEGPSSAKGGAPSSTGTDAGSLGEWQTLLTGDWSINPGEESYTCVRKTLAEDTYIRGVQAINPVGTHHTFLGMGDPTGPDGVESCAVTTVGSITIFGSGVGTNPVEFPTGVGMKLPAGTQLLLNLHLFNTGTEVLSGTSGTKVMPIDPAEIAKVGESLPAVDLDFSIPPREMYSTVGSVAMDKDTTIFAVLPHMHQLGIHMKVTASSSVDGDRVLHDAAYDFDSQLYYAVDPIRMATGDQVQFECTWNNTRDKTIVFGQSSLDEMCAVGIYRYYPAP